MSNQRFEVFARAGHNDVRCAETQSWLYRSYSAMRRFLIHISQPPSIAFRACRIADAIEQYVAWLVENRCAARSVLHRMPIWYIW
jgi:hypothetical protein